MVAVLNATTNPAIDQLAPCGSETFSAYYCRLLTTPEDKAVEAPLPCAAEKPYVQFYDLNRPESAPRGGAHHQSEKAASRSLRWVHATNPTPELLTSIAHTVEVSDGTLGMFQKQDQRPAFFRSREACVVVLDELQVNTASLTLESSPLFAIINDSHLVTLSPRRSPAIAQIQSELHSSLLTSDERTYSNTLLARLVGCVIHRNEAALRQFELAAERFAQNESSQLPSAESRERWRNLRQGIQIARRSISPTVQVVRALGEKSALYGATPKDSLQRYEAILNGLVSTIEDAESHYSQVAGEWDLNQDTGRNLYQARLNILAAALGPPSLAASVIQALGGPWPEASKWGLLGLSLLVSATLLACMRVTHTTIERAKRRLFGCS